MRRWRVTLALCFVGTWCAASSAALGSTHIQQPREQQSDAAPRPRRSADGNADRWLNLIADYTRGAHGGYGAAPPAPGGWGGWFPPPIPVQVPLPGDNGAYSSVPLLVVPVPVPVPAPRADPTQCHLNAQQPATALSYSGTPSRVSVPASDNPVRTYTMTYTPNAPPYAADPAHNTVVSNRQPLVKPQLQVSYQAPLTPAAPVATVPPVTTTAPDVPAVPVSPAVQDTPARVAPQPRPPVRRPDKDERIARNAPKFPPVEDSRLLVEQFRAQQPTDPTLPPVVIEPVAVVSTDDYTFEELEASNSLKPTATQPDENAQADGAGTRRRLKCRQQSVEAREQRDAPAPPPLPRFERSLFLRARLTVPRADYTEPYSLWWDAASGASRVDFHGGTTSSYRMMKRDGQTQSVMIREDRTGETNVRRCVVSVPRRVSLAERALPALPDLQAFSFAGHVARGAARVERWRHTLSGHAGELGGARGEALTFRHELLVARAPDNHTTTPLRYSVRVDSSVLGPDCDGYVHYFDEVQPRHHDANIFKLNLGDACEQIETTHEMESVEPLREFTMLRRHPRYDAEIERYKRIYERRYADDLEEAVRKNVLMQSVRHTSSGNRQGASFELATNFLSDRLVVEQRVLMGVAPAPDADPGEPFPHSRDELDAMRGRLPRKFDWRELGGVTPVRYQNTCSSCWAFATVGAVEGALFAETGRLVPLSEQALVDCAGPYGGNGCKGTWPTFAYNYIKDNGLPALDEYTPYQGEVLQCRADSVPPVTRISGHVNVTKDNILALKMAIRKYGPTVVIIDAQATSFISYKKTYYHDGRCRKNSPNHAVLAVGWTTHRGETYFIIKNSWSAAWGMEGYMNLRASTNTCGVLRLPSHPRLRGADVQRVPAAAPAAAAPAALRPA